MRITSWYCLAAYCPEYHSNCPNSKNSGQREWGQSRDRVQTPTAKAQYQTLCQCRSPKPSSIGDKHGNIAGIIWRSLLVAALADATTGGGIYCCGALFNKFFSHWTKFGHSVHIQATAVTIATKQIVCNKLPNWLSNWKPQARETIAKRKSDKPDQGWPDGQPLRLLAKK